MDVSRMSENHGILLLTSLSSPNPPKRDDILEFLLRCNENVSTHSIFLLNSHSSLNFAKRDKKSLFFPSLNFIHEEFLDLQRI